MHRTKKIRILVSSPLKMPREVLIELLTKRPGFEIVGEAGSGPETIEKASLLKPDIVLIYVTPFDPSGMETLRGLAQMRARTIIFGGAHDTKWNLEAIKTGVQGILSRSIVPELLLKSIRSVAAGEYWIARQTIGDLIEQLRLASASGEGAESDGHMHMTQREWDVAKAVIDGMTNKDIASSLRISAQTVKHHLTSIFKKMGVTNRLELALYAMRRNEP